MLAAALVACGGPSLSAWPRSDSAAGLAPDLRDDLVRARAALDEGDTLGGLRLLRDVRAAVPEHVGVAIAVQDAELAHLAAGRTLEELDAWLELNPERVDEDPAREYWSWYLSRSRRSEDPLDRLLTARVEPDRAGALFQLEKLAEEVPEDPWPRLGVAHSRLVLGDVEEARAALEVALARGASEPRVHRLEALLLAREGQDELAIDALERWLERTADDPLVGFAERDAATLELAASLVDARAYASARRRLDAFIEDPRFETLAPELRFDAFLIRSAALADSGRYERALADAERALDEDPERLMAYEQRALLLEYRLDDPAGAHEAWAELERRADGNGAEGRLRAYLYALRARVEQARLTGGEPQD